MQSIRRRLLTNPVAKATVRLIVQILFPTFSLAPQAQMKRGSQARRKSLREFAFAKRNAEKRLSRSAEREEAT